MKKLSTSIDRFNNWKGKTFTNDHGDKIDAHSIFIDQKIQEENDPDWKKNNLEYDLRTNDHIINKVQLSQEYGRKLYAALCNNEFIKREMWQLLKEDTWSCSWRYAGGILADIVEKGDYMDWYCGGDEGYVDEEIKSDLYELGWLVVNTNGE